MTSMRGRGRLLKATVRREFVYCFNILSQSLNQPEPPEAGMAVAPDDDVVVHAYAERLGRVDDHLRHVDVGARRSRIAGGMVVDEE